MPFSLALAFWTFDPVLKTLGPYHIGGWELGPFALRWYAIAYIAGLVLGWLLVRKMVVNDALFGGRSRPTPEGVDDLLAACAFGVIAGGRLGNIVFFDPQPYLDDPLEIFRLWHGGMSFHGGLIGVLIAVVLFSRRTGAPWATTLDLVSAVAPIGIFFGRLANFIKPELWGRVTDVAWGVIFPKVEPLGVPRHPSQLYEAGLEGLIPFVLLMLAVRAGALKKPGLTTGLLGVLYGSGRIFCEFFRDPDPRLEDLGKGLTMGMVLSAPLIAIGLWAVVTRLRGKTE